RIKTFSNGGLRNTKDIVDARAKWFADRLEPVSEKTALERWAAGTPLAEIVRVFERVPIWTDPYESIRSLFLHSNEKLTLESAARLRNILLNSPMGKMPGDEVVLQHVEELVNKGKIMRAAVLCAGFRDFPILVNSAPDQVLATAIRQEPKTNRDQWDFMNFDPATVRIMEEEMLLPLPNIRKRLLLDKWIQQLALRPDPRLLIPVMELVRRWSKTNPRLISKDPGDSSNMWQIRRLLANA